MKKTILLAVSILALSGVTANAYTIHGKYASLISCDYGWSQVRGESGYTGTYDAMGEIFTIYFGSSYCEQ